MSGSTSDHTAARVLVTLVRDPKERAVRTGQETDLDTLVLTAMKEVPEVARKFFSLGENVGRKDMRQGTRSRQPDIVVGDPDMNTDEESRPAVLIEVKGMKTNFHAPRWKEWKAPREFSWLPEGRDDLDENRVVDALDVYRSQAREDARCYLLMPEGRAQREDPYLQEHSTVADWKVITFEQVAAELEDWGIEQGSLTDSDVRLAAALMRVKDLDL